MRRALWLLTVIPATVGQLAACTSLERAESADAGGAVDEAAAGDTDGGSASKDGGSARDADAAVGPTCDGACPPEDLADMGSPYTVGVVAVDGAHVYFRVPQTDSIYACPKTGCASAPTKLGTGFTFNIVALGGIAYWGDNAAGKLWSCPATGCGATPTAIVTNQTSIAGVWTDGAELFWTAGENVMRCSPTNCSPQVVRAGVGSVTTLAVDQGRIFWEDPSPSVAQIVACTTPTCSSPSNFGVGTHEVAAYGGQLFWGNVNTLLACSAAGCAGNPRTIALGDQIVSPVSDGLNVYFRDRGTYEIHRCPLAGCAGSVNVLATFQFPASRANVAVDGTHVYWGAEGFVRRVPK